MQRPIFVIKKSGDREPFSEEKVMRSMQRAGLPSHLYDTVLAHIKSKLHPDIETAEIFAHIQEYLEKEDKPSSLRFNLKRAIFELGPTGFPFEVYISKVFTSQGYNCEVGLILQGDCVKHEVDLLIEKDGNKEIMEAKFHNQQGTKTDVQVALYTHARFLDLKNQHDLSGVWIVTNTKLTEDATQYARCKGVKMIGWNYPAKGNLQDFVENPQMYPITILDSLTLDEKRKLLEEDIVLCKDLAEAPDYILYEKLLLDKKRMEYAKEHARMIYATPQLA